MNWVQTPNRLLTEGLRQNFQIRFVCVFTYFLVYPTLFQCVAVLYLGEPVWHRASWQFGVVDLIRPDIHRIGEGVELESMKPITHLKVAVLLLGLLTARALEAAEGVGERREVRAAVTEPVTGVEVPDLKIPSNLELPDSVKGLAEDFRTRAQNYVERQKEVWKRAEGASKSEREKLKEQMKANRAEFLQQTRQIRAELKERIKEVQKTLSSSRPFEEGLGESGIRNRPRK